MLRFGLNLAILFLLSGSLSAASLRGRVLDARGAPVAGVRLMLLKGSRAAASTVSDGEGRFRFEHLPAGSYGLRVRRLGFRQEEQSIELGAQDDVRMDVTLRLDRLQENVTVTATRTETPNTLIGSAITVITADQIRAREAVTVSSLLDTLPGVHVAANGGPGSLTSVFIRGGDSDYTKVLLDGIPLNLAGGSVDLSALSTANVERIEIVRGSSSALFGSDAMAGVIQIFTRKGAEGRTPRVELLAEGGSFDTFRSGMEIGGSLDRFSYSLGFQHLSTDNARPNDFFHSGSLSSRFDFETSPDSTLTLVGRLERSRSGVPGATAFGRPDLEEFYRKRDLALGARWSHTVSDRWSHRVSYSQSFINQLSEDPVDSGLYFPQFEGTTAPFPSFDFPFSFQDATRRHLLNYQSDFHLSSHLLSAGFDYEEERGTVGSLRAARTNFGYYLQDQFLLGRRLAVTAGLRFEDNGSFGFFASPRLSLSYLLRNGSGFWGLTRPRFNFGLGIKEPTFTESFSPNFFFQGNPDLDPERSRSFEAGLEQLLAGDRARLEVSFFHTDYRDQVAFQVVDFETFEGSFFNLGHSRAWGLDQVLTLHPRHDLAISAGYSYLNSTVLESASPFNPVFREGADLLRRPRHAGFLTVSWTSLRWRLNSSASFVGDRADSDFLGLGLTRADGYTRWDLTAAYRFHPRLELFASARNLLNQEYSEVLGFPALKFHFRSGVRLLMGAR